MGMRRSYFSSAYRYTDKGKEVQRGSEKLDHLYHPYKEDYQNHGRLFLFDLMSNLQAAAMNVFEEDHYTKVCARSEYLSNAQTKGGMIVSNTKGTIFPDTNIETRKLIGFQEFPAGQAGIQMMES